MKKNLFVFFAVLAAALYALNAPLAKILLDDLSPTMMAGLLYLGAGFGLAIVGLIRNKVSQKKYPQFGKSDIPFILGMIVLDVMAPIFLMVGLTKTTAENASLLNNFEIVSTSLFAFFLFKETISRRLWLGILLITIASAVLTVGDFAAFQFSLGSVFILLATICWGLENNCTRQLASKDALQVVVLKGIFSGATALAIALLLHQGSTNVPNILFALLLGFTSYGLSIFFYVLAQKELGASKTSAYYAIAPFLGAGLSFLIFRQIPGIAFFIALVILAIGTYFTSSVSKKAKTNPTIPN